MQKGPQTCVSERNSGPEEKRGTALSIGYDRGFAMNFQIHISDALTCPQGLCHALV